MRICLYTDTALPKIGGQETDVDALARHFLAFGHEPIVLAPLPRKPLRPDDSLLPYPVYRHWRFFSTRVLVGWYRRFLCQLHKRLRFDVLHCHGIYPPAYLAALSRESLAIPMVITSHGGDVNPENVRVLNPILRARHIEGLRAADALISISRFTRDGYRRLCPEAGPIVDISNGVELEEFGTPVPVPEDLDPAIKAGEYLLFLGRLRRRKGVDVLLEALTRIPGDHKVQLVVAGGGDSRSDLEALAGRLGLRERVRFVGQVRGPKKVYLLQNALVTVVPSREWEALGLVVLESFAASTPVIVSDLPGLADNVRSGHTGFIVPVEASELLAERLRQALAQPDLMRQMGLAGRQYVAKYSWKAVAAQHLELFDRLRGGQANKVPAA